MTEFTPISAVMGGALIGLASTGLLLFHGRIAGISGIFGGLLQPRNGDVSWRLAFVVGLLAGGLALIAVAPETIGTASGRSLGVVALGGVLVGFGTRMGNGCTSGHGVCGLSRFSVRSLVAVLTFMGVGMVVATVLGGVA